MYLMQLLRASPRRIHINAVCITQRVSAILGPLVPSLQAQLGAERGIQQLESRSSSMRQRPFIILAYRLLSTLDRKIQHLGSSSNSTGHKLDAASTGSIASPKGISCSRIP